MTTRLSQQATRQAFALGLAALLTFSVLGALDLLATQPAQEPLLAASPAASQVVVVESRRGTRG
jgi:hypothetical protein